jgi:FkbM family methyltransferase
MFLIEGDCHIARDLQKQGEWEPEVARHVEANANPDWTFLDLGAHCGFFALLASKIYKHVIAVEPNPAAYSALERSIELNEITNIELHKVALWKDDGGVDMFLVGKGNTGMSWVAPKSKENTVSLPSLTLGQVLQGRKPEVWKVDIEGAEVAALKDWSGYVNAAKVIITEYCTSQIERTSRSTGRAYWELMNCFDWYTLGGRQVEFYELPTGGYDNFILTPKECVDEQ